jgi:hypothetical protein
MLEHGLSSVSIEMWWLERMDERDIWVIEIHGRYEVQNCLLSSLMMEAARTSETSVENYFTRQYIPEDNSEHVFR